MTDYGLNQESNERVYKAIEEFKKSMAKDDIESFLRAVKENNISVTMDYDLSGLEKDLVALIVFGKNDIAQKSSTIYIDKDIKDYKLFFYLAHEVGHHLMHYEAGGEIPQIRSREKDYMDRFKELPLEEQEAEVFAYNLLMPINRFCSVFNTLKEVYGADRRKIISDLATFFFAGEEFSSKRLEFLEQHSLLEWG